MLGWLFIGCIGPTPHPAPTPAADAPQAPPARALVRAPATEVLLAGSATGHLPLIAVEVLADGTVVAGDVSTGHRFPAGGGLATWSFNVTEAIMPKVASSGEVVFSRSADEGIDRNAWFVAAPGEAPRAIAITKRRWGQRSPYVLRLAGGLCDVDESGLSCGTLEQSWSRSALGAAASANGGHLVVRTKQGLEVVEPDTGHVLGSTAIAAAALDVTDDGGVVAVRRGELQRLGPTLAPLWSVEFDRSGPYAVAVTPDGRFVLARADSELSVRDGATGRELARTTVPSMLAGLGPVALSRDGEIAYAATPMPTPLAWRWRTEKEPRRWPLIERLGEVQATAVAPDGSTVAQLHAPSRYGLGTAAGIVLYEGTGQVREVLEPPALRAAFSADGGRLVVTGDGVSVWGVEERRWLWSRPDGRAALPLANDEVLVADGDRLVVVGPDGVDRQAWAILDDTFRGVAASAGGRIAVWFTDHVDVRGMDGARIDTIDAFPQCVPVWAGETLVFSVSRNQDNPGLWRDKKVTTSPTRLFTCGLRASVDGVLDGDHTDRVVRHFVVRDGVIREEATIAGPWEPLDGGWVRQRTDEGTRLIHWRPAMPLPARVPSSHVPEPLTPRGVPPVSALHETERGTGPADPPTVPIDQVLRRDDDVWVFETNESELAEAVAYVLHSAGWRSDRVREDHPSPKLIISRQWLGPDTFGEDEVRTPMIEVSAAETRRAFAALGARCVGWTTDLRKWTDADLDAARRAYFVATIASLDSDRARSTRDPKDKDRRIPEIAWGTVGRFVELGWAPRSWLTLYPRLMRELSASVPAAVRAKRNPNAAQWANGLFCPNDASEWIDAQAAVVDRPPPALEPMHPPLSPEQAAEITTLLVGAGWACGSSETVHPRCERVSADGVWREVALLTDTYPHQQALITTTARLPADAPTRPAAPDVWPARVVDGALVVEQGRQFWFGGIQTFEEGRAEAMRRNREMLAAWMLPDAARAGEKLRSVSR